MEVFTFSATTQPTVIRKKRNIVTETEQHVVINAVVTGAIFAFDIEEAKKLICESVISEFKKKRMIVSLIINKQKII